MKKAISVLVAILMVGMLACAAAEEAPQAEGGKKFEKDWAIAGGLVEIYYEEQGYRVSVTVDKPEKNGGSVWYYTCDYKEAEDALVSFSSSKADYTYQAETGQQVIGADTYSDFDDAQTATRFTIDAEGKLIWKDGREDAGAGLMFEDIGRFKGTWKNEAEEVEATIYWEGADEDHLYYTVYLQRGKIDGEQYTLFLMTGTYQPETGKLTVMGPCTHFKKNAEGGYDSEEDLETYDATFSLKDGNLVYETANGIELEYDLLGGSQG